MRTRGFSLLEIAIVLAIIGTLLAGSIVIGLGGLEASRYNATVRRMDDIHKALLAYSTVFDRLPCPSNLTVISGAANFGIEAANKGTCTGGTPAANSTAASGTVEGGLPTRTLQLPDEYQFDAWGRRFRYAVNPDYTADDSLPVGTGNCTSTKAITVKDAGAGDRSTNSVYALISHGANGHGGYTRNGVVFNAGSTNTDEQTNCHCDTLAASTTYSPTYVQKLPTESSTSASNVFDDIATYREAWQLQTFASPLSSEACKYIFVVDSGNYRIQKFDRSGGFMSKWGSNGSSDGQFRMPTQIRADSQGNVHVMDLSPVMFNPRIQKFDVDGNHLQTLSWASGSGDGQFLYAFDFAMDSSGNIYITDFWAHQVQKFDSSGTFLLRFGSNGTGDGQFDGPTSIAVDASDNVIVGDYRNDRIQKFSSTGTYMSKVALNGGNDPYLGIGIDSSQNIYVACNASWEVQKYNSSLIYQLSIGGYGTGDGQWMDRPYAWVDSSDYIWTTDTGNDRVQKFNSSGTFLLKFGSNGSGDGQLNNPSGIVVTSR